MECQNAEFAPGQVAERGKRRDADHGPGIVAAVERRLGGEGERIPRIAQVSTVFLERAGQDLLPARPALRFDVEGGVELDARALRDRRRVEMLSVRMGRRTG